MSPDIPERAYNLARLALVLAAVALAIAGACFGVKHVDAAQLAGAIP